MNKLDFWITNTCKRNVNLSDLNLNVKAYSSVNLLDKRHYDYTIEQLQKSAESGSIYKKRKIISVRKVAPTQKVANVALIEETYIPSRNKSIFEVQQETYDELLISDEQFADENAEIAEIDRIKG